MSMDHDGCEWYDGMGWMVCQMPGWDWDLMTKQETCFDSFINFIDVTATYGIIGKITGSKKGSSAFVAYGTDGKAV